MLHWTPQRLLQPGRDIPSCLASYLSGNNTIDQALVLPHLLSGGCTGVSGTGQTAQHKGSLTVQQQGSSLPLSPLLVVAGPLCHQLCTDQAAPWQLCSGAAEPSALLF